jgi:anti-sigma factor RsiW
MNCKNVKSKISEYLENDLPNDVYNQISEHLSSCSECHEELEEMRQMLSVINKLPHQEPVFDLWTEFAPKMHEIESDRYKEAETAFIPRLQNALHEGWTIFTIVTGYNTRVKFRFLTGAG